MSPDIELLKPKLRSPRSWEQYTRVLGDLGDDVSIKSVRRWWNRQTAKQLSDGSLANYAAIVKSYLRSLAEEGDKNALASLKWIKRINVPRPALSTLHRQPITTDDLEKIRAALPNV